MKNEDNFDKVKQELIAAHNRGLKAVGLLLQGEAQLRTPVDTGYLKGSIIHETEKDSVKVGTNAEYAHYVEYGTSNQAAQPYLRPALYDNDKRASRIYADHIKEVTG